MVDQSIEIFFTPSRLIYASFEFDYRFQNLPLSQDHDSRLLCGDHNNSRSRNDKLLSMFGDFFFFFD